MTQPDLYAFADLWRHYRACRRNKRNTINALAFEIDLEANLLALQQALRAHTYEPGRSICFITEGPKPREVFAADFRDRVVHHLLVWHQERVFEPIFIHDSYACRIGKGTLAASDRLMTFLRCVTVNGRRPAWALKLDVASFFPSIHKRTLSEIMASKTRNPELLWLTRVLLFHDPTTNYVFRSRREGVPDPRTPGYPVPARKSLFGKHNERGLPIGNLTSQFWGNVYLNELDQFVKRTLKCSPYVRYVDDMILLSEDRATLVWWRGEIEAFLRAELKLELRADLTEPFRVARGIDFVGWKTWWNRRVPRRRTLSNFRERLDGFERAAVRPIWAGLAQRIDMRWADGGRNTAYGAPTQRGDARSVERLHCVVASYSGHLRHGAAMRAWARVWARYPWLDALFVREGWAVEQRWARCQIRRARCFQNQYWQLTRGAGESCLVFCQVGRFVEFYGGQRLVAARSLGLRTVYAPRAGYAFTVGFPLELSAVYTSRAVRAGLGVLDVRQGDSLDARRCRPRQAVQLFVPARPLRAS